MIHGMVVVNPRRKAKSRNKMKVRYRSRRRTRRNPPHSAAMRRKIGAAVKRAMAAKKRAGGSSRRRSRTRTRTVTKTRTVVVRAPRRRSRSVRRAVRRHVRARRRTMSGLRGSIRLGSLIRKENLMLAGGVIGSTIVTRFVMNRVGGMLPGATHPLGQAAYTLGVSFVAAKLAEKVSKPLAEGILIGGLVTVVNSVMSMVLPAAAVGEYLGGYDATMSLGPATQQLAQVNAPTPQIDAYLDSQPAFENSAW